ncbi:MAG: hypothetical protein LIO86_02295 [Lachnospiraceae bacterium]|nr:hypothetical protein [Lachnospiraceae bacterium]
MDQIQQLADYIDESHSMVAITGAGISLAGGGVTYSQLSQTVRQGSFGSDNFCAPMSGRCTAISPATAIMRCATWKQPGN